MELFSGLEYLKIDIANCYGLDKKTWQQRIDWVDYHYHELEELVSEAKDKYLMAKAVLALREVEQGKPTGHIMFLDSTSSGIQLMACLSGCLETAERTNLINTGNREDAYSYVAHAMNKLLPEELHVDRGLVKEPLMQHFYNKMNLSEFFNEEQEEVFYQVLMTGFTGAEEVKDLITECWNPTTLAHSWIMPDNHTVICKVKEMVDAKIPIDELGTSFTYRFEANNPSMRSSSLAANVIHS